MNARPTSARFYLSVIKHRLGLADPWKNIRANAMEVRDYARLKKAMGWQKDPVLEGEHLHKYEFLEDLNDRRLRDAEALGGVCCNGDWKIILEIGTALGHSTALMAQNAPNAKIFTVNIPPEEIAEGGNFVTFAPTKEEIGSYFRQLGLPNITQIYANTAKWEPNVGSIDVAFIDGCHDADFVYNDTVKILRHCHPGSILVFHDFSPRLIDANVAIQGVCEGVERLYWHKVLKGPIFQLQDSFMGIYKVP